MILNSRLPSAIFTNRPTPSSIARSLSISSDSSRAPRSIGFQLPSSCRYVSKKFKAKPDMRKSAYLPQMAIVSLGERDEVVAHRLFGRWRERVALDSRSHMRFFELFGVVEDIGTRDTLQWHSLRQKPVNQRVFDDELFG